MLTEAIDTYRRCLAVMPGSEYPLLWDMTQMNLGAARQRLGRRESENKKTAKASSRLSRGFKSKELTIKNANEAPQKLRQSLEIAAPAGVHECNGEARPVVSLRQQTDALCL